MKIDDRNWSVSDTTTLPVTSYISREALIKEFLSLCGPQTGDGWDNWGVRALIDRIPPADVNPVVRGEWVEVGEDVYKCTVCKAEIEATEYCIKAMNFCPNCGADMRKNDVGDQA